MRATDSGDNAKVSVILPVYNEERNLALNFTKIYRAAAALHDFEIIIVDNGSTDNTGKIATRFAKMKHVKAIKLPLKGRGRALKSGIRAADGGVIGYMDIDLAVPLRYLDVAVEKMHEGNDVVIGSRYMNTDVRRDFVRLVASRAYNWMLNLITGSRLNDHQCGFKFWSRSFIKGEATKAWDNYWFFDTETLLDAQKLRLRICQLPVFWREHKESKVKASDPAYFIRAMLRYVATSGRV